MNVSQAFKMAFKSILTKKGRSVLTMLGIIIGIASVMIIVSVVNGSNQKMMEYYESMGTNKINVSAYSWNGRDMFKDIYDYCLGPVSYTHLQVRRSLIRRLSISVVVWKRPTRLT